jgi:hypothetical protein
MAVSQGGERQTQVNGSSTLFRSSQPAIVPLVEGKVYRLGSGTYEAAFDASANRWQLEDVTNYQRNLLFEDDGSLVEARYDPNLIAYKAIGPSGFTVADIHDASDPSSFTIADFHHASMKSNATAYWLVALQNSVKSFKRAAPREQLANGPDMIGQICGHGRGGLER